MYLERRLHDIVHERVGVSFQCVIARTAVPSHDILCFLVCKSAIKIEVMEFELFGAAFVRIEHQTAREDMANVLDQGAQPVAATKEAQAVAVVEKVPIRGYRGAQPWVVMKITALGPRLVGIRYGEYIKCSRQDGGDVMILC